VQSIARDHFRTHPPQQTPQSPRRQIPFCPRPKRSPQFGVAYSKHIEGDGAVAFERACEMGLEGIVSKRRNSRYISGRTEAWLKIKNPNAPGVTRFQDRE
jgi:hypothetical protein